MAGLEGRHEGGAVEAQEGCRVPGGVGQALAAGVCLLQESGLRGSSELRLSRVVARLFIQDNFQNDREFDCDIKNTREKQEHEARFGEGAFESELAVKLRAQ